MQNPRNISSSGGFTWCARRDLNPRPVVVRKDAKLMYFRLRMKLGGTQRDALACEIDSYDAGSAGLPYSKF